MNGHFTEELLFFSLHDCHLMVFHLYFHEGVVVFHPWFQMLHVSMAHWSWNKVLSLILSSSAS